MQVKRLQHLFCTHIPEDLEPGVLYVSMEYATAAHSCCCGCGEEVVTPFTPTDWKMTFDGWVISLSPSVGNWTLPCQSHYVVRDGAVIEAGTWSEAKIAAERRRDRTAKARYYKTAEKPVLDEEELGGTQDVQITSSWWQRIWNWTLSLVKP